jgi:hypothetical protein
MCGRSPAAEVTVQRTVGMLLVCRQHRLIAPLCRGHGEPLVRDWTRRTLIQGWWSYRSWVPAIHALIGNRAARKALSRLPHPYSAPEGRADDEPFPEHLGWGLAAFEPKPEFDARERFGRRPTFGDRLGPRAEDPTSAD